jgi:hypothetical protein
MKPSSRDRAVGAVLVGAGVLFQSSLLGRAASLLSVALVLAYVVWVGGAWSFGHPWLRLTYGIGLVVFLLHATEEYLNGFPQRLPGLVGVEPWTNAQYLCFNAVWFATFLLAARELHRQRPVGTLVVLFFALAGGLGNGIAHLFLTLRQGAYFPGAWTAPLCLVVGGLLIGQLFKAESAVEGGLHSL